MNGIAPKTKTMKRHRDVERPAGHLRGEEEQRNLAGHHRHVHPLQAAPGRSACRRRAARTRPPCRRRRAARRAWRDRRPRRAGARPGAGRCRCVVKLKIRLPEIAASVITVNTRASTERGRSTMLLGPLGRRHVSSRGTTSTKSSAAQERDDPGTANAVRQPAYFTREAREHGGHGDTEIAGEAVEADREARILRVLDEHGNADRVVDRRERAHHGQRDGQRSDAVARSR